MNADSALGGGSITHTAFVLCHRTAALATLTLTSDFHFWLVFPRHFIVSKVVSSRYAVFGVLRYGFSSQPKVDICSRSIVSAHSHSCSHSLYICTSSARRDHGFKTEDSNTKKGGWTTTAITRLSYAIYGQASNDMTWTRGLCLEIQYATNRQLSSNSMFKRSDFTLISTSGESPTD